MKTILKYWFALFILIITVFACNSSSKKDVQTRSRDEITVVDTMHLQFDVVEIDSMYVIIKENEKKNLINVNDKEELGRLLSMSVNDTVWNNSGIMVKMVTPDYTIISHYRDQSNDNNSWLMIWKENGRLKFDSKWYFLPENNKNNIFQLLDKYK